MGFFSRKESTSQRRPVGRTRPSVSSEAQAAELRVRARRRLVGAVAIVLCAIIVLPMLLDSEPVKIPANIEVSIPSRNAPFNPVLTAPAPRVEGSAVTISPSSDSGAQSAGNSVVKPAGSVQAHVNNGTSATHAVTPAQTNNGVNKPIETEIKPSIPATAPRPDEGARARAILEGRAMPSAEPRVAQATPAIKENLVVQIASYSVQADAQARSETLKGEGITNAYVEPVTVNGKQVFRLRVGPFSSREAAQAAQARLRTLGYANGFITTQ
jgi:DedD protein